ncbi:hypothetical protein M0R01_00120 [bacterium]|nr:hypothetical protein [bacterium]
MIFNIYISILIAGFGGGVVRGMIGYLKHQYDYKKVEFNVVYFLGMAFLSGIIGLLSALAIKEAGIIKSINDFSPAISFIVGYAGGDFLDGVYKIILQNTKK